MDDALLRYQPLNSFDAAMHKVEERYSWLASRDDFISLKVGLQCAVCTCVLKVVVVLMRYVLYSTVQHEGDKMIVFDKAGLVFVFNFHHTNSFTDYMIGVPVKGWCVRDPLVVL